MRIKNIVNVKPISTVIDFQSKDKTLIDGYIILEKTGEYFLDILEGFSKQRDDRTTEVKGSIVPNRVKRCHKISGTYGVGKSYFLLMIRTLLESLDDKELYNEMVEKFLNFPSILYQLDVLESQGKHYIVVDINGKDFIQLDFKSTIEREVHRKLSKEIGRENLNFNTFYEKSANQLIQWENNNSPMYELFKNSFEKEIDFTYEEMINGLNQREKSAKEGFEKVYMQIMNEETRDHFNTLGEFLDEADRIAKENGYAGIVIIFDEFSSYLRGRAETGFLNMDLASIDILTEKTLVQNAKQIHFITSEHEDIEKILEENLTNLETVKKTAGRFKDYQLYFDRGSKLVENVMEKDQEKLKKLKFNNQNTFSEYNKNNESYKLEEIYPLNPFTLEYLIKISEKYAQGDRTLFTFMDEEFRIFVESESIYDGQKLNLLGVDTIMDSFERVILSDKEEFARAYNTQMKRTNTDLEKRLVKALALDYAISITDIGRIGIGINDSNLKYILSLTDEELEEIKEYLTRETNDSQSYIIFNSGANGYELSPDTAGINLEEEIRKELSNTNEKRLFQDLLLDRANALDIRTNYTLVKAARRFPFDRKVEGKFINSLGDLKITDIEDEIATMSEDGKILFFIPPAGQNYDFNKTLEIAKAKSKEFINHSIVIGIPKKSTFASDDVKLLKRYEAIERLTKNENIMNSPKAQNQIRLEIVNLRNQIYSKLGAFGRTENFIFLFKDEIMKDVKSMEDILTIWMVDKLYPKFPVVNVENFVDRNSSTPLIDNLIISGKAEAVDINSSKVFSKQIRETLQPLDLVKLTLTAQGYRVEIKYPEKSQILEIFDIFKIPEKELSLKAKYSKLTSSPFGLNDPLFETLFATFLMVTDGYYLVDNNSARVEVTSENIKNVWENCQLAETKDAVPYIVKLDLINILEIIDKNYVNSFAFSKLKPTAPSDDFGHPENTTLITNYIKNFNKEVELFLGNLRFLPENPIFENKIDDLYKELESFSNPRKPEDMINDISQLIDKFFDNGIKIDDTQNKINFDRYAKLQNFIDNTLWLKDNINDLNSYSKNIDKLKTNIKDINIGIMNDTIETTEKQVEKVLNHISSGDNWKDGKYKENISIEKLEKHTNKAIKQYNGKYIFNHDMLEASKRELSDSVIDYEHNSFIETLEKIQFDDLDKLSEIQGEINSIKRCNKELKVIEDTIVECSDCGNLSNIYLTKREIENKQRDITKKLGRLVYSYMEKIEGLNSVNEVKKQYNRDETIAEFIRTKSPEHSDTIKELISIIRYDWLGNKDRIETLIENLYPIINEFIETSKIIGFNEINFSDVMKQLNKNIKLSGYKNMNFDQFQNEVLKEINKIGEKYDVINIIE